MSKYIVVISAIVKASDENQAYDLVADQAHGEILDQKLEGRDPIISLTKFVTKYEKGTRYGEE